MQDNLVKMLKATIICVIVALLFSGTVVLAAGLVAGDEINTALSMLDRMSVEGGQTQHIEIELNLNQEKKRLESYPNYGTKYGQLQIESVNIDLPIYFGDTNDILKLGVGHYSGSYFPGEGGAIVYAAHNTAKFFRTLPDTKVGDEIKITTDYGEFKYKVYDTQVIHMSEEEKLPIQDEEEILMIYTCYPVTGVGHKTHRFVVYAKPVEE